MPFMPFRTLSLTLLWTLSACAPFAPHEPKDEGTVVHEAFSALNLKSEEICVVTHNDKRSGYAALTAENHEKYAKKHGYFYHFYTGRISGHLFQDSTKTDRIFRDGLYWQKVTAVKKQLERPECKWVMWVDADTAFTNFNKKIEDVIQSFAFRQVGDELIEKSLIIPKDESDAGTVVINNGVFILRNNEWSKDFINSIESLYPRYKDHPLPEQDAFRDSIYQLVKAPDDVGSSNSHTAADYDPSRQIREAFVIPQRVMDSFYRYGVKDTPRAHWKRCDFIAHISGTSNEKRIEIMGELDKEIKRYPCD